MAKIHYNSAIHHIQGAIDGWVYKKYKDKRGVVLSRRPDMSRVKPSAAQKAHRKRMRDAAALVRSICCADADPTRLNKYRRLAKQKGITVSAAIVSDFFKKK